MGLGQYFSIFRRSGVIMSAVAHQTLICVKQVKQEEQHQWDDSMPLPGDIIVGFAEKESDDALVVTAKGKAELSHLLGKMSSRHADEIWLKVRRGEDILKLRTRVVPDPRCPKLNKKRFTVRAVSDDRHVVVLGDLSIDQCLELQEMSRQVVNMDNKGFRTKGMKYNWNMKMATHLPDSRCPVVMSILLMPLVGEHSVELTTARCMAWYTAAISSGVPLVFVDIQTEQIVSSERPNVTGKEITTGKLQQNITTVQIVQGIRLWFLPGIAEVPLEFIPESGEAVFGMEIKKTEEGFFHVISVARDSAADRSGLGRLYKESMESGYLLVISRLEKKSLVPSSGSSDGLLNCCDQSQVKETLVLAMERMESVTVHVMAWPSNSHPCRAIGVSAIKPPSFRH